MSAWTHWLVCLLSYCLIYLFIYFSSFSTDYGSMWLVPLWNGTKWRRPRRSLCWRMLSGKSPERGETNPGSLSFSSWTPSPQSGPTDTWSKTTLAQIYRSCQFTVAKPKMWTESCKIDRSLYLQHSTVGPWSLSRSVWEGRRHSDTREEPATTQRDLLQPQLGQSAQGETKTFLNKTKLNTWSFFFPTSFLVQWCSYI